MQNVTISRQDGDGWAVLTYAGEGREAAAAAKDWLRENGISVLQWGGSSSTPARTRQRIRVGLGTDFWGWQAR